MLYSSMASAGHEAVDRSGSGLDRTRQVIPLSGKLCSVARSGFTKRLELPVSRGAGGHYSGAVVIPDVRRPHREGDGHGRIQAT